MMSKTSRLWAMISFRTKCFLRLFIFVDISLFEKSGYPDNLVAFSNHPWTRFRQNIWQDWDHFQMIFFWPSSIQKFICLTRAVQDPSWGLIWTSLSWLAVFTYAHFIFLLWSGETSSKLNIVKRFTDKVESWNDPNIDFSSFLMILKFEKSVLYTSDLHWQFLYIHADARR